MTGVSGPQLLLQDLRSFDVLVGHGSVVFAFRSYKRRDSSHGVLCLEFEVDAADDGHRRPIIAALAFHATCEASSEFARAHQWCLFVSAPSVLGKVVGT